MGTLELGPIRCLVPAGDRVGEGATWHADENAVYWTDINRFLVHRHHLADGKTSTWLFDEPVVALSITTRPDLMLVALASKILLWQPNADHRHDHTYSLASWPSVRMNDGRTDPRGSFWIGSMRNNVGPNGEVLEAGGTDGVLVSIAPDRSVTQWRDGIGISNTLCWSPDRNTFYFADTLANMVWAHDYAAATGAIGPPRPFFAGFDRGWPDGSAMDSEGFLWNCRFGGGCIVRIAPDGSIDRVIDMPVTNVTTAAFGGPDLTTLFVTTASAGAPERERLSGSLFAIETNVRGLPENRFIVL